MTLVFTTLALTAFAANSIICRLALGAEAIDAASFTTVRLASGAALLLAISAATGARTSAAASSPSWRSAVALFSYAILFSWAYLSLTTGTGALILFAAVQTTMMVAALWSGERPRRLEWIGLASAVAGLIVLVFPGLAAPPPLGSALMAIAGISWGFYSLWGHGTTNALAATTVNFVRALPLAAMASLVATSGFHVSVEGIVLATSSGALASGVGYVIWYAALPGLSATRAATVQLAVPVLAAMGGVLFLSEDISVRLVTAAVMILGGIALAIGARPLPASGR